MIERIKKQSPARIIALGFALVILVGSLLLMLPCSIQDGVTVRYIDALYRIPSGASLAANSFVTMEIPALEIQYSPRFKDTTSQEQDDTLTIVPRFAPVCSWAIICRATALSLIHI